VTDGPVAQPDDRPSVFINCPFDAAYRPLFDAIVFAVIACGHLARSALEIDDGGRARFGRIVDLIRQCPLGVHDLSRVDLSGPGGLPRFNMPLELGLFLGASNYGDEEQRRRQSLVLDADRIRYRDFISDLSGHDIKAHGNEEAQAITSVRNFLRTASGVRLPGGAAMAALQARFKAELPAILERARIGADEMTFAHTTAIIFEWLKEQGARSGP
jgi:hypothetical protein